MSKKLVKLQGILNGVFGDYLAHDESRLAIEMGLYHSGYRLDLNEAIAEQVETPISNKLVIFVHGLTNTESIWDYQSPEGNVTNYGKQLEEKLGYTPLFLRYNSGLSIKDNGRELSERIQQLFEHYPLPIEELILVGFSMGGLLIRHAQLDSEKSWTKKLHACIYIGTPHEGAKLEQAGSASSKLLQNFTKPYLNVWHSWAELRSQGIKDLHSGFKNNKEAFHTTAKHCFISGGLLKSTSDIAELIENAFIGDSLVVKSSAHPEVALKQRSNQHFSGLDHFTLARNPMVYDFVSQWVESQRDHNAPLRMMHPVLPNKNTPLALARADHLYFSDSIRFVLQMGHKVANTAHTMHDSISDEYYARISALPVVKFLSKPVEASHKSISTPIFKTVGHALQLTEKSLSRKPQAKPTH
jgi:pimeloyl-ACP methyl ester carboxylesterase